MGLKKLDPVYDEEQKEIEKELAELTEDDLKIVYEDRYNEKTKKWEGYELNEETDKWAKFNLFS